MRMRCDTSAEARNPAGGRREMTDFIKVVLGFSFESSNRRACVFQSALHGKTCPQTRRSPLSASCLCLIPWLGFRPKPTLDNGLHYISLPLRGEMLRNSIESWGNSPSLRAECTAFTYSAKNGSGRNSFRIAANTPPSTIWSQLA